MGWIGTGVGFFGIVVAVALVRYRRAMKSPAGIFHRTLRSIGGRHTDYPDGPSVYAGFPQGQWPVIPGIAPALDADIVLYYERRAEMQIRSFYRNPDWRPNANKMYFDWVSSLNVNAVATTTKTVDLIGVNVGCIPFLHALFGRMFCYPAVFPALGNAAAEARKVLTPVERRPTSSSQMFPEGRPIGPEDLLRNYCAFMCAGHALDFLMVHEIGHVTNGHCDLLKDQPLLLERVQDGGGGANFLARQMLEIDADSTAVTALAKEVVTKAGVTYDDPFKTEMFGDARKGLTYWLFAVFSMWHCFVPDDVVDVNRLHTYTHPPARMRQISIAATLDEVLKVLGYDDLSKMIPSIEDDALRNAEIGFSLLTGNPSGTKDVSYASTPEANAHIQTVLAQWNNLYPRLEPLARYKGLLPKPH